MIPEDLGILTRPQSKGNPMSLEWCPSVRAMLGTNPTDGTAIILAIRCRRWTCPYCRTPNEILLKEKVLAGKPSKMLTLTCRPNRGETPVQTRERARPFVSRLYQDLRRRFGGFEAATFMELHRSGYPHWHALVRSPYIPVEYVRSFWTEAVNSPIVDIRKIQDTDVARRYVTKYVVKQLGLLGGKRIGRVVAFTRKYDLSPKPPRNPQIQWSYHREHPLILADRLAVDRSIEWHGRVGLLGARKGWQRWWIDQEFAGELETVQS